MAGLGRKIFTAGDILLASEVQGFLQDQSVMVFDDDAARTAAIATPTEGMVTFTKDNDQLEVFDGSTFKNFSPGLVHIESQTVSAVSAINFNDVFSANFDNYFIVMTLTRSSAVATNFRLRASGSDNTTANYSSRVVDVRVPIGMTSLSGQTSNEIAPSIAVNANINLNIYEPFLVDSTRQFSNALIGSIPFITTSIQSQNISFDGFSVIAASGTITGSLRVYGITN